MDTRKSALAVIALAGLVGLMMWQGHESTRPGEDWLTKGRPTLSDRLAAKREERLREKPKEVDPLAEERAARARIEIAIRAMQTEERARRLEELSEVVLKSARTPGEAEFYGIRYRESAEDHKRAKEAASAAFDATTKYRLAFPEMIRKMDDYRSSVIAARMQMTLADAHRLLGSSAAGGMTSEQAWEQYDELLSRLPSAVLDE